MTDSKRLIAVILAAVVAVYVLDLLLARYGGPLRANVWVAGAIAFGLLAYIIGMIATRGRIRLPSLPRRRPLRVVKRDPSAAAADFIKRFEDRSRR